MQNNQFRRGHRQTERAKQTQFAPWKGSVGLQVDSCANKPNLLAGPPSGRNLQNEPNFRRRRRKSGSDAQSSIRSRTGSTKSGRCTKQSQSARRPAMGAGRQGCPCRHRRVRACETKPISRLGTADWGQTSAGAADCAKRTQFGRHPGADGAKRTQFRKPTDARPVGKQTHLAPSTAGSKAPAALLGPRCETKPIWRRGADATNHFESWLGGQNANLLFYHSTIPIRCVRSNSHPPRGGRGWGRCQWSNGCGCSRYVGRRRQTWRPPPSQHGLSSVAPASGPSSGLPAGVAATIMAGEQMYRVQEDSIGDEV
jgi:hypothetical protein